ncbi:tRNA pseudouridine(55) synthase TruB [Flaviflexus salsibiostraticola]|uniref:tRNA pseudouridine synthase B n=1 Tax=Flaviflexus salsibiostraticola TaxID=1282737 RepID=A0A3S8Z627_9ACTO|nr:tRNA pseudouridine(55) synthase TruB [Flaviflexus salsibiostraticola]AZN28904.1 tRNA pseudouridine(55) synthase TruB [Flaviflexus salsibiostraticola]
MIDVPRGMFPAESGIIVIDKPAAVTSHDVVAAVRRLAQTKKVGHAGTLDPAATGVLVLGIGAGTKLLTYLSGADKDYESTFRLGQETATEDAEGEILSTPGIEASDEEIDAALVSLTGQISQVPSAYSAKKIDGRRACDLARAGETVELKAVDVTIDRLVRTSPIVRTDGLADFDVAVTCSSGTYIRALARQTGQALGSIGHITALRRTRVGGFHEAEARSLDELADVVLSEPLPVIPMVEAARRAMATVDITAEQEQALRFGQFIDIEASAYPVALIRGDVLVAIGRRRGNQVGPAVVFAAPSA